MVKIIPGSHFTVESPDNRAIKLRLIMLYSMTGFGKAVTELPGKKITVEIKSLNSKQIDIAAVTYTHLTLPTN